MGMRKRYTAEQREKLLREVRATGEKVSVVAERMGVTKSSAYLWTKELRAEVAVTPAPVFARVVPQRTEPRGLLVEVGGTTIRVEAGFDAELFRSVVAALREDS